MATEYRNDSLNIGLDDGAGATVSRDLAQSLLRLCATPDSSDRSYSSVIMLTTPNGANLYEKTQLFG